MTLPITTSALLLVVTTNRPDSPNSCKKPRVTLVWRQNQATSMTITRTETVRQSDRVAFRMPIEASWLTSGGLVVKEQAVTLLISRNGGVIRLQERLRQGQELTLKRTIENGDLSKTARARVVAEIDRETEGFLYAIHLLEARSEQ